VSRWIWLGLFTVALWAGAFGISVLVVEWRADTVDVAPLADDIAALKADVAAVKKGLGVVPVDEPTLEEPTPFLEEVVVMGRVGAVAEWRGLRLTIEDIQQVQDAYITVKFIVENVSATPQTMAGLEYGAVDHEGFSCGSVNAPPTFLRQGEKVRADAPLFCGGQLNTLTVGGIRFEFP